MVCCLPLRSNLSKPIRYSYRHLAIYITKTTFKQENIIITFTCKECGKRFSNSPEDQRFYISKGLQLPKRCKDRRKIRKVHK